MNAICFVPPQVVSLTNMKLLRFASFIHSLTEKVYSYAYLYVSVSVFACFYIFIFMRVYMHTYIYCKYMYACIYMYMYVNAMYVCEVYKCTFNVYIWIYLYACIGYVLI